MGRFGPIPIVILFLLITSPLEALYAGTETIVIIVHKDNPMDSLFSNELERIYKGQFKRWKDGKKMVILNRPIQSEIRLRFYRLILNAEPTKRFHSSSSPIPFRTRQVKSDLATKKIVARIPQAIGYIYLRDADASVKILRIDGLDPVDDHYKLR